MRYQPQIDGLRAIAVTVVILYHAGVPGLPGGFVGVDVFFVISGYLITGLVMAELGARGRLDYPAFLLRRIRRLLPLMLVVALIVAPLGWFVMLPNQFKDYGQSLVAAPFFVTNILFWHEAGYFTPRAGVKPLLHLWSLGVEAQFYLLMPLVLVLARRIGRVVPVLTGLLVASFAASLWASHAEPDAAFYLLPFRMWEFLAGALISCRRGADLPGWAGLCGLGAIGLSVAMLDPGQAFPGWAALVPVGGATLVLASGGTVLRVLSAPALVRVGVLSYGLYLWHYPIFVLLRQATPDFRLDPALPVLVPLLLGLSWLGLRFVETPWRRPGRARQWGLAGLVGTSCAAGFALHLSAGAPARLPTAALVPLSHAERWGMPCHGVLSKGDLAAGRVCRIGDPGAVPHIVLIGDSHAGHLTPALGPALAARGKAALVFTRGWCAPLPGFGTNAPLRGPECGAFMQQAWAALADTPGIDTVVLAAQWSNFTQGTRAGHGVVLYGDAQRPDENPAAFAKALDSLGGWIAAHPHKVVLIDPVPEYDAPVPEILARSAWRADALPQALRAIDYERRNTDALRALTAFSNQTGARRLKTRALFCEPASPDCRVATPGGLPYYRDEAHLSTEGAKVVVESLMPLIEDAAIPGGGFDADFSMRQPPDPHRWR